MAMIWFNAAADTNLETTLQLILEKTGVEITVIVPTASNDSISVKIRFPDMEEEQEIGFSTSLVDNIIFVDADKHFFATVKNIQQNFKPNIQFKSWLTNMVFEDGEILIPLRSRTVNSNKDLGSIFNIPGNARDDQTKTKIKLFPAYYHSEYNTAISAYVQNLFVQYERIFSPGLKLMDEKGRKFVTLGSYLLYQTE